MGSKKIAKSTGDLAQGSRLRGVTYFTQCPAAMLRLEPYACYPLAGIPNAVAGARCPGLPQVGCARFAGEVRPRSGAGRLSFRFCRPSGSIATVQGESSAGTTTLLASFPLPSAKRAATPW